MRLWVAALPGASPQRLLSHPRGATRAQSSIGSAGSRIVEAAHGVRLCYRRALDRGQLMCGLSDSRDLSEGRGCSW